LIAVRGRIDIIVAENQDIPAFQDNIKTVAALHRQLGLGQLAGDGVGCIPTVAHIDITGKGLNLGLIDPNGLREKISASANADRERRRLHKHVHFL
jgi:hypothetical protein